MSKAIFVPVKSGDHIKDVVGRGGDCLVLVAKHGLGDWIFFSPCFEELKRRFRRIVVCSCVNAYTTIFESSNIVEPLYAGGFNGNNLNLTTAQAFCDHFSRLGIDLGLPHVFVYHFGLFEPTEGYDNPRAFCKGRRNALEMGLDGWIASETPKYHVGPDPSGAKAVSSVLDRWLPERELVVFVRYGHTDCGKNFGHDAENVLSTALLLDMSYPGRFRYISFDYSPGAHEAEGRAGNIRSVYGWFACNASTGWHIMSRAKLVITVPTGPMVVAATLPGTKLLTLWSEACPFHLLDPQYGRVSAIVSNHSLADTSFTKQWEAKDRNSLMDRWDVQVSPITPETVADKARKIIGAQDVSDL